MSLDPRSCDAICEELHAESCICDGAGILNLCRQVKELRVGIRRLLTEDIPTLGDIITEFQEPHLREFRDFHRGARRDNVVRTPTDIVFATTSLLRCCNELSSNVTRGFNRLANKETVKLNTHAIGYAPIFSREKYSSYPPATVETEKNENSTKDKKLNSNHCAAPQVKAGGEKEGKANPQARHETSRSLVSQKEILTSRLTTADRSPAFGQAITEDKPPAFGQGVNADKPPAFGQGVNADKPPAFGQGATADKPPAFGQGAAAGTTPAFGQGAAAGTTPAFGQGTTADKPPAFGQGAAADKPPAFGQGVTVGTTPAFGQGAGGCVSNSVFGTTPASGGCELGTICGFGSDPSGVKSLRANLGANCGVGTPSVFGVPGHVSSPQVAPFGSAATSHVFQSSSFSSIAGNYKATPDFKSVFSQ